VEIQLKTLTTIEAYNVSGAVLPVDGFVCYSLNNEIYCGAVLWDPKKQDYVAYDDPQKMKVQWLDGNWYFYI
jgi:hypothetical protein